MPECTTPPSSMPASGQRPLSGLACWLKRYAYRTLGREISLITRYFQQVIHLDADESGALLPWVEAAQATHLPLHELARIADLPSPKAVLLNGTINHSGDVQGLFDQLRGVMKRHDRVVAVLYNPYVRFLFGLMNVLGLRRAALPTTFIGRDQLDAFAKLSGFEVSRIQPLLHIPFCWLGLGTLLNRILRSIPGVRWAGLSTVVVLRPVVVESGTPSLSIVIPARNEEGNIGNALAGLTNLLQVPMQVIFVEGNSTDRTWDAIQDVVRTYQGPIQVVACRQKGKGKKDAVEDGFALATGDLLTILDADLTMPPERLIRFYDAYVQGRGDFINGSRLVYPMEDGSMQFLNHLGNIFFAKALSFVTDTRLTDSLCGTKLVARVQYDMIKRWCADFGDFDPFGDFELIFPAAALGLGSVDIPVRYRARTYGSTNISRFRHGVQLLRMTAIGLFTLKIGRMPPRR